MDNKKPEVELLKTSETYLEVNGQTAFDEKATKRLIRKIDFVLLPFLSLLYLLSFLDRTNIGNARLGSLEEDLKLHDLMYNVVLAAFFPTYALAEIPSNMMMKRIRPSIWIPSIMVVWGIICICMGLVHNYAGIVAARAFLGLAEGGLFPGIAFYISMWYRRHECGLRMAIFFSAATAAGAFGGLLARGLVQMHGLAGRPGWAWIFIVEGALTLAVALSAFYFMQDYPDTATFLTEPERVEVKRRLDDDRNFLADEYNVKFVWDALKDWKIYVFSLIGSCLSLPVYSVSLFMPTIVKSLHYKDTTAQLMTTPPYIVACAVCITGGFLADKTRMRGPFMIAFFCVGMIGFLILILASEAKTKYIGCFFVASGIYPSVPQGIAWLSNNIGGSLKRSIGIAMFVMFSNFAAMTSGFVYLPRFGPSFRTGHLVLLSTTAMSCALAIWMTLYLGRENRRRDAIKPAALYTDEEKVKERENGDDAGFFRYTV
jgi:MFS family permease